MKKNLTPLLHLAYPLILSGLAQNSVYFFETLFLSKLGNHVLAAGSLVSWLAASFIVVLFGTLGALNILISHRVGAQKHDEIALVVRDGFRLSFLLTIPSILLYWYMDGIFLWLGQDPSIIPLAKLYLHALAWGLLPNFLLMSFLELLMGLGHSHVILKFSLISVLMTIVFSFLLIFGYLGLPVCGIAGAGWGVTIGQWLTLGIMTIFLKTNKQYHVYLIKLFDTKPSIYIVELLKIGLPMGLMYGIEITFVFVLSLVVGYFGGSLYLAANQIAFQYVGISMAIIFSLSQAITVRMGHLLGAKQKSEAYPVIWVGSLLNFGVILIISLAFWFMPNLLIAIDVNIHDASNQKFILIATQFLCLCGFYQILESVRVALFGAVRAFHETRFTMWVSLITLWGIALPMGYALGKFTILGAFGIWYGMMAGVGISIMLLLFRLASKKKNYLENWT